MKYLATLKDVAKLAGVDPSVVSRVINKDKAIKLKPETRQRILDAVNQLNYRPNASARNLKKGETKILGMVIPDFLNPVYATIIQGVEYRAQQEGYDLLVYSTQNGLKKDFVQLLREGRVDGLLVASSASNDAEILELQKEKLPFVLVNRVVHGVDNYVTADDKMGAKLAVEHLIHLGHTQIGHIAGPLFTETGLERFHGYRAALQESNVEFKSHYVCESKYSAEDGYRCMNNLLELADPPTAVFAANMMVCIGAMRAIQERGLSIPKDISIVGFHDILFTSALQPPLTTVKMPLFEMGEEGVKKLIKILRGENAGQGLRLPGATLVIRGSTAPYT